MTRGCSAVDESGMATGRVVEKRLKVGSEPGRTGDHSTTHHFSCQWPQSKLELSMDGCSVAIACLKLHGCICAVFEDDGTMRKVEGCEGWSGALYVDRGCQGSCAWLPG